ncbi:serine hydrolase domain-containing protein [Spongiimicrobium salis]|uniref:serine hydrolase domain-containing protein n=1 Tax=Spongiimicrobium salis TaxID=1667022 RepID=UPI00374CF8AD
MKDNYLKIEKHVKNTFSKGHFLFTLLICMGIAQLGNAQQDKSFITKGKQIKVSEFNKEIEHLRNMSGVPAISLAVIEDNKVVFSNVYGYKQMDKKIKADENTVFEACSLTKPFLISVIYQLVEEGRLDLDKPISHYLKSYEKLDHDKRTKLVTTRMILSHTSGIENWKRYNDPDVLEFLSDPGEKFVYSGEGFEYLASAVEVILNEQYFDYITRMVLKPLGLKNTVMEIADKSGDNVKTRGATDNYAFGHGVLGGEQRKYMLTKEDKIPGGLIHTTAGDYAKLIVSFFDGSLVSKKSVAELQKPIVKLYEFGDINVSMSSGLELKVLPNDTIVGFSGSNFGYKAEFLYSIKSKRGFVYFTNSDLGKTMLARINELTSGFDLDLYNPDFQTFYPVTLDMIRVYREDGESEMFRQLISLKEKGNLKKDNLRELSQVFEEKGEKIVKRILAL